VRFDHRQTTVTQCYTALADQVETGLGVLDPYFVRLAEAMRGWIELWEELAVDAEPGTVPESAASRSG